ncbi:MAG TPA: hypothetical protein VJV79_12735 [Polyangiaceae bacterium]|nr:hypothetical protein [Polyangiaceae bacterium]
MSAAGWKSNCDNRKKMGAIGQQSGNRAADPTRQLLMFSRQQVIEPKVVLNLNGLLAGTPDDAD